MESLALDGAVAHLPAAVVLAFQGLCVGLVCTFLGFCCVPRLHEPARALLHRPVLLRVEAGLEVVLALQRLHRPWLTAALNFLSHTVSVGFYVSREPVLVPWPFGAAVAGASVAACGLC